MERLDFIMIITGIIVALVPMALVLFYQSLAPLIICLVFMVFIIIVSSRWKDNKTLKRISDATMTAICAFFVMLFALVVAVVLYGTTKEFFDYMGFTKTSIAAGVIIAGIFIVFFSFFLWKVKKGNESCGNCRLCEELK